MNILVDYLLESALILGLLIGYYRLALYKEALFNFNRFFLLMSLVAATVIPALHIPLPQFMISSSHVEVDVYTNLLDVVTIFAESTKAKLVSVVIESPAFMWLYLVGCMGLLVRLLTGFVRLGVLSNTTRCSKVNGVKFIDLPGQFSPFSFFNVIFINQSRYSDNDLEKIVTHEMAHVRLKHSLDVILLELLLIVQWFNPFAWLLRYLLKELHEFQADRSVLSKGISVAMYKELLLFQATGARLLPVNNFNQSLTQKRFKMMTIRKIKTLTSYKPYMAIAILLGATFFFACEKEVQNKSREEGLVVAEKSTLKRATSPVHLTVDIMPEYPKGAHADGQTALKEYISETLVYPKEAIEKNLTGRVYISFVVNSEGGIQDTKVARSSGHEILDTEAIRVISLMKGWKPGMEGGQNVNVSFTMPVNFELKKEEVK